MDREKEPEIKIHQGENVKRIRSLFNISQDFVADKLGVSQQTLSLIEQKEIIDDETLTKIAAILNVSVDVIKNMNEESTTNYFNTFNSSGENCTQTVNSNYNHTYNYFGINNEMGKQLESMFSLINQLKEEMETMKSNLSKDK